jgi:trimethylamine:corrinoid methyltransferase-like protein
MVRAMISGLQVNEENLALDVIQDVVLGNEDYLVHPHTVARCRRLFEPLVFTRHRMQDWLRQGSPSAHEEAACRAKKILAEHFPAPLSREQVTEIERIAESYRCANR